MNDSNALPINLLSAWAQEHTETPDAYISLTLVTWDHDSGPVLSSSAAAFKDNRGSDRFCRFHGISCNRDV